jgi:DNA repair exonuclease SbcCD ATPase subunit
MITIKSLEFDFWFSYGEGNYLDISSEPLTQVKGDNGNGKSSIAWILQELHYGKNTKGFKKQELLNRNFPDETLWAKSIFTDDSDDYEVELTRKSTLKLILRKNGEDISSHTSTNTYKTLEGILGMDFKTFAQLTYQSSKSSLQFLTATDTNRKNFLTSLFNLQKYTEYYEIFKEESRKISKEVATQDGKIETITAWIKSHEEQDREEWVEVDVPEIPEWYAEHIAKHRLDLSTINQQNVKISDNNAYLEMMNNLNMDDLSSNVVEIDLTEINESIDKLNAKLLTEQANLKELSKESAKVFIEIEEWDKVPDKCDKCGQDWPEQKDLEKIEILKIKQDSIIDEQVLVNDLLYGLNIELKNLKDAKIRIEDINESFERCKKVKEDFERLNTLIDKDLPIKTLDKEEISEKIKALQKTSKEKQLEASTAIDHNKGVAEHNSKVNVINEQLEEYNTNLESEFETLGNLEDKLDKVDILKKAFSSTGLITYKLEFLVKDLEKEINSYLLSFSDGKFQIDFNLKGEKLNIDIINNGVTVSIESLSEGQLSRVNVSTLLAIRKLMMHLSSTKINILFLDEIMGVLDLTGKETLIDVLLKEQLNTYLVSHDYQHPLVPVINIIMENEESRIE